MFSQGIVIDIKNYNGKVVILLPEGISIGDLTTVRGLTQLFKEPTNFEPNKNPSCIDLVFTDQPNLVLESGTRTSLDPYCHHQITHCRFNFKIPPPPPLKKMGGRLINPNTSQKSYLKMINSVMNKCKAPKIIIL